MTPLNWQWEINTGAGMDGWVLEHCMAETPQSTYDYLMVVKEKK